MRPWRMRCARCKRSSMRPASRRALLKRLGAVAPTRGTWIGSVVALISLVVLLVAAFSRPAHEALRVAPATERHQPLVEGVLALPFGESDNNAAVPPGAPAAASNGPIEELRAA